MSQELYHAKNGHTGVKIRNSWAFINGYAIKKFGNDWKKKILKSPQEIKTYTLEQLSAL